MTNREALEEELRQQRSIIHEAYWKFTRCANAKPPILVVPEAYKRAAEIERMLKAND